MEFLIIIFFVGIFLFALGASLAMIIGAAIGFSSWGKPKKVAHAPSQSEQSQSQ